MHFTATCTHSAYLNYTQDISQYQWQFLLVELADFTTDLNIPPTYPLNPINPDNACILRITAAAGTELADAYSYGTCQIPTRRSWLFIPV